MNPMNWHTTATQTHREYDMNYGGTASVETTEETTPQAKADRNFFEVIFDLLKGAVEAEGAYGPHSIYIGMY